MSNTPWRRVTVELEVDSGVTHSESVTVPNTPGSAKGTYWVRSDSPTVPMYTDSSGTDFVLNLGSQWQQATIQTTDASPTSAATAQALLDGEQTFIEVEIRAEVSGTSANTYTNRQVISYYRDGGGAVQWGIAVDDAEQRRGTLTTATATLTTSGNNIIIQVTGQAATTIDWTVQYRTSATVADGVGVGGGGTAITMFSVDVPPLVAETEDDEFTTSTLDPKWTEWDVPSNMTVGFDGQRLTLTQTTGGGVTQFAGIFQPVPSSEFTAYIKVASNVDRAVGAGTWHLGLVVGDDLTGNPATSTFASLSLNQGGNVRLQQYTDYNGPFLANMGLDGVVNSTATYLRVRLNGTTISTDWSSDGQTWNMITDAEALPFTPGEIGIHLDNSDSGQDLTSVVEFFRVVDGVSSFDQFPGRRITVSGTTTAQTVWGTTVETTTFTAAVNTKRSYDASTFAGQINLPDSPSNGDEVILKNQSSSTANVTVSGNGNNLEDPSVSFSLGATGTLSGDGASFTFSFDGTQWLVI